jgi:hypothetical protein
VYNGLAQKARWSYTKNMDTQTQEHKMKTDKAQQAVINLLKSKLANQREDVVKAAFFNVFKDIDKNLARVLWLEAKI